MTKKMLLLWGKNVIRNGRKNSKQLYKCKDCGKQFLGGRRRNKLQVITDYVEGKQTLAQLAQRYRISERTIQRDLESMRFVRKIAKVKDVTVQLDTTYWGQKLRVNGHQRCLTQQNTLA